MVKVYHDKDIDGSILEGKKVAVIGYGSQGRAQALNMRDSGVDVVVGLRPGGSWDRAVADGMEVRTVVEAAKAADIILMLVPDMAQPVVFKEEIAMVMGPGKTLQFAHGFNIHYNQIQAPEGTFLMLPITLVQVAPPSLVS